MEGRAPLGVAQARIEALADEDGVEGRPAEDNAREQEHRGEVEEEEDELEAEEARKLLQEQEEEDLERMFEEDEPGQALSSPEHVTDDEVFDEKDFEVIEAAIGKDGEERFWEVEECVDLEQEEAPKRRALRDPGEPSQAEWEEHRVDHIPYRSWCPHCVRGCGVNDPDCKGNKGCLLYTSDAADE